MSQNESITGTEQSARYSLASRVVLLATDGTSTSAGATHVAYALAQELGAGVHVVSVFDTRGVPIPSGIGGALQVAHEVVGQGVHTEQEHAVRGTLAATLGRDVDWPVRMSLGAPSSAIVREARRLEASMIVMGLRRHGRAERVLNDETTLNVVRTAPCPVLGVVPDLKRLPRAVLAAVDFSSASMSAASVARALIPREGRLTLAYVSKDEYPPDDGEGVIHALGVEAGFERASRALAEDGVTVDHVVLHPKPMQPVSELLLELSEGTSVEVVAAGSARLSRVERWMLGSVTTDLVRDGRLSVLVVPPAGKRD
jgi:nucleotide-binding universal stress UspA family protein